MGFKEKILKGEFVVTSEIGPPKGVDVKEVFEDALTIPLYAVITLGGNHLVYVEKNGVAQRRVVELGILSEWQVQITDGLAPGDNVIVVGHRLLGDGQHVTVIKTVTDPEKILTS